MAKWNRKVLVIKRDNGELKHTTFLSARQLEVGWGRFSKVPRLFGRISGDIILFVSSKWRRLEARNFAVILIFIPCTTYEQTSFTD